jgi:dsDNA-binding SOS-regulon protein
MSNKNLKDQSNNKQQNREKSDIKFDLGNSDLNEEQKEILSQFLNQNRNVFATNLHNWCAKVLNILRASFASDVHE